MQVIQEVAKVLHIDPKKLQTESLRGFLEKDLNRIEAKIYGLANKHGVKSIFELDKKLKKGQLSEEEMLDDFMQLDFLESKRDEVLKAMEKLK